MKPFRYTHEGRTLTLKKWARVTGVDANLIYDRLRRGYAFAAAISNEYGRKTTGEHGAPKTPHSRRLVHHRESARQEHHGRRQINRLHSHLDMDKTLTEWAAYAGVTYGALRTRMHRGSTLAEALAMPKGVYRGVPLDLGESKGTGGGSTAQAIPNLTFSDRTDQ